MVRFQYPSMLPLATGRLTATGAHSDVTVSLTASDTGSSVKEIHSSENGGAEVVVPCSAASTSITTDGTYTMSYYAVDNAGNREDPPKSLSVNLDRTPPTITISAIADGATYALGQVPSTNYSASDSLSGLYSSSAVLSGGSGFGLGTFA